MLKMNKLILLLLALFLMFGSVSAQSFSKRKYRPRHHCTKQKYQTPSVGASQAKKIIPNFKMNLQEEAKKLELDVEESEDEKEKPDNVKPNTFPFIAFFGFITGFILIVLTLFAPISIVIGLGLMIAAYTLAVVLMIMMWKNPKNWSAIAKVFINILFWAAGAVISLFGVSALFSDGWRIA